MRNPVEKRIKLLEMSSPQFGLFTAKQAEACGYSSHHFNHHVNSGEWVKEDRGLFRLATYPASPEQVYMRWQLWTRNRQDRPQGCLSHETALFIYKISDILPNKIHMTVPRDFRRNIKIPGILVLHHRNLPADSMQIESGLTLTTPARTLEDLLDTGTVDKSIIQESLHKAIEIGLITKRQLDQSSSLSKLRD